MINAGKEVDDFDVTFDPGARTHFTISGKLRQMGWFKGLWEGSDLASVIGRFADSTHKKYLHLDKHREKARFKTDNDRLPELTPFYIKIDPEEKWNLFPSCGVILSKSE